MSIFNLFKKQEEVPKQKRKIVKETSFYSQSTNELPQNFAQNVMQLQMQLQFVETYDIEVVHKLNQMYRIAIEYYINVDQRKANHFQRKLTTLLTHPHTLEMIQKKSNNNAKAPHTDVGHYNSQLKQQLNKFNSQSDILVKSILDGAQKKVQRNHKMIYQHLQGQQDFLKRRLLARSKSKSKNKDTPKSPSKQ